MILNWEFNSAIAALVTTPESPRGVDTLTVVAPVLVCVVSEIGAAERREINRIEMFGR